MKGKTKGILGVSLAVTAVTLYAVTASLMFPKNESSFNPNSERYPAYGVSQGDIVKFDLSPNSSSTEPFFDTPDENIVDFVMAGEQIVYVTEDDNLYKATPNSESELIKTEAPAYYSMSLLEDNKIAYLVSRAEVVPEDEAHKEAEDHGLSLPHEVFYSIGTILDINSETAEPKQLLLENGEPVKIDKMETSPEGTLIVAVDLNGDTHLYDSEGSLIEKLPLSVSKIGFLNEKTLWFSHKLGAEEHKDQHIHLYNLETGDTQNLYEENQELSNMSVLDIKELNGKYIILANSYKTGEPKQTLFSVNTDLTEFKGIVNLSSLSLNSNGKIHPVSDDEYLLDVRGSENMNEVGTFRMSASSDTTNIYPDVSQVFVDN